MTTRSRAAARAAAAWCFDDAASADRADPADEARAAGLVYVTDASPGLRRERRGRGFAFVGPDGPIDDERILARIRALAIPPAWTDVWISATARGHIQATGRDARGRKQYRYHPRWRAVRDATKFARLLDFAEALPALRERVDADLSRPGLPREKVTALVVRLLERTLIRVGNDEYARDNESYGLTTLRDEHVRVNGSELRFRFRGKSGRDHAIGVRDPRAARIVKRCRELPGQELFRWLEDDGEPRSVGSGEVNDYLREATGRDFTAKDFRTWAGTVLAAMALAAEGAPATDAEARASINAAVEQVAAALGNTKAIARRCYVHPLVVQVYEDGRLTESWDDLVERPAPPRMAREEAAVAVLLREAEQAAEPRPA